MFILYAVAIGLAVGFLAGGRIAGLASLRIRWSPVIMAGLLVQVALFTDLAAQRVGDLGPILYVASTFMVLAAIIRNRAIPGMVVVVAGAACNLAAIIANGGYMPAGRKALEALGETVPAVYSNSSAVQDPALWPLTDIFALPRWLPWTNIFSIGDVLIGVGIALVIVRAMRRPVAPAGVTAGVPAGVSASGMVHARTDPVDAPRRTSGS
jgi:hypothetical protein